MRCQNFQIPKTGNYLNLLTQLLELGIILEFEGPEASGIIEMFQRKVLASCCITMELFEDFLIFLQDFGLCAKYTIERGNKYHDRHNRIQDADDYYAKIKVGQRTSDSPSILLFCICKPRKPAKFQYAFTHEHIGYFLQFLETLVSRDEHE